MTLIRQYGILCGLTDFVNIADFLKLKENYFKKLLNLEHGTPSHDCLSDLFAAIDSKKFMEIFIVYKKVEDKKNHGRIEKRSYYLSYDTSNIVDKEKWKTVGAIAYVRVEKTIGDETSITDNYYIIDYKIEINMLENVIRDHWSIECGLHWKLDVILDEDHSRNRIGNSINNLAIVRKMAFNLASLDTSFGAKKNAITKKINKIYVGFQKY